MDASLPADQAPDQQRGREILWPCHKVVHGNAIERELARVLIRQGEVCRGRDLSEGRLKEIETACKTNKMELFAALSLRRQLLRRNYGHKFYQIAAFAEPQKANQLSALFEKAVSKFFTDQNILHLTEEQLKEQMRGGALRRPTPDILFTEPVTINGTKVNWIDCKTYYGCAMLHNNKSLPVGRLAEGAEKYTRAYGSGAFVFVQGFNSDLALALRGVLLLDASPVDLTVVNKFQTESGGLGKNGEM